MPFGRYRDVADCVKQNSDKRDPQAYCAVVKRKIEDHKEPRKRRVRF